MNQSIMVVGAHADDIEIETGGTLLKYREIGYDVVYVMSTNNFSGGVSVLNEDNTRRTWREDPMDLMARRKGECDDAAAALGTTPIHLDHPQRHYWLASGEAFELRYGCPAPEGFQEDTPSILTASEDAASVKRLTDLILEKNPECVLTHSLSTMSIEHFATSTLVTKSYYQAVDAGYRGGLLHWREAPSRFGEFNFRWDTFVDYSPFIDRKMELIGLHRCQMPHAHLPDFGHRLYAEELGRDCGCGAAECFAWVRRADDLDDEKLANLPLLLELVKNSR
jgi:LmbE family N-acetylglucosaminyl deacetylase